MDLILFAKYINLLQNFMQFASRHLSKNEKQVPTFNI